MNKMFLVCLLTLLGFAFIALAFVYWFIPANALPNFLPGHQAGLMKIHYKHGVGSLLLGLGAWALAWFQSGRGSSSEPQ